MQKKNKIIIIVLLEFLFLTFITIVLPTVFIKERPGVSQTNFQETLSLDIKNNYLQELVIDQNNLQTISVLLKNPALQNTNHVYIDLLNQNKNKIRSLTTSGLSIGDPSWINFKFPYIPSRSGDKFYIKLTSDNPKSDTLFVYGNQKDKSINLKTTYVAASIQESLKNTISEQITQLRQRNLAYSVLFFLILITLNIFLFLNL